MFLFRLCLIFLFLTSLTACQGIENKSGGEYVEQLSPLDSQRTKSEDKKPETRHQKFKGRCRNQSQESCRDKESEKQSDCGCQQNESVMPPCPQTYDEMPPPEPLSVDPLGDRAPLKRKPNKLLIMSSALNFNWS